MVVSNAAMEYGVKPFGFFEFALAGIPLLIGTTIVLVLLSERLLPDRTPRHVSADLSRHARTLARHYGLSSSEGDAGLFGRETGVAEVLIPPRSPFIGDQVSRGMTTDGGDLVVVGIQRGGRDLATATLRAGDALALQGPWHALEAKGEDPGVLAVDDPGVVRRQAVPFGLRAWEAIAVLVGMVVLLVTGFVPPAVAGLLAAGTLIVLRVLSMEQAYRSVTWTTVVLVAAMLPLSTAMFQTGAADLVADLLIRVVGGLGPYGLLAGLFVVTAVFGQLISNTATALIMIPIAAAAAGETGVDLRPVLMSVCVASAAALLTPVATPVNLIAMGAAGYRFGDYWKLGIAVMAVFFVVSVLVVPIFWPFA